MAFDENCTVIFDLDGTLIDSAPVVAEILNAMRKKIGKPPLDHDFFRKLVSRGAAELVATSMEIAINDAEPYVNEFRQQYKLLPTPLNCLYSGVTETISFLSSRGVKIGICSNKPEFLCRKVIHETGLSKMIDIIAGGDTMPFSKPSRVPIDFVIQHLGGMHESTLLVGDSTVDQRAAAAANISFVFFSNGYDDGVDQSKAFSVIDRLPQLLDLFDFSASRNAVMSGQS